MQHLFEKLREDTLNWRKEEYPSQNYPLIGEILRHQFEGEAGDCVHLKYLREPQFQSLELYWYIRLVLETPHIVNLYRHYYDTGDIRDFCEAFGIPLSPQELILNWDVDTIINLVENNPEFVKLNFPDFVIVKNTGEFYIIEIKSESERGDPTVVEKKKAVERLAKLQPDAHFEYKVIYTRDAFLQENFDEMQKIREWIYGNESMQNSG